MGRGGAKVIKGDIVSSLPHLAHSRLDAPIGEGVVSGRFLWGLANSGPILGTSRGPMSVSCAAAHCNFRRDRT